MSGRRDARDQRQQQIRAHADELVANAGLPRNLALQVAMGNLTLNTALQKLAFRDEVEKLIRRHDFPRSLATQIALGQVKLDDVLQKRRMQDYIQQNRSKSILMEAQESGQRTSLLLHGMQRKSGVISDVSAYEFRLTPKKGPPEVIHKLQARAAWDARKNAAILSCMKQDKERAVPSEPIVKPQDRFHCSNRRLFVHMELAERVTVRLLEGDVISGTIDWIGRWEFGVKTKRGPVVTVFRHAMTALEGA